MSNRDPDASKDAPSSDANLGNAGDAVANEMVRPSRHSMAIGAVTFNRFESRTASSKRG